MSVTIEVNAGLKPSCIVSSVCSSLHHCSSGGIWREAGTTHWDLPLQIPFHTWLPFSPRISGKPSFPMVKAHLRWFLSRAVCGSPYATSLVHPVNRLNKEPTQSKSRWACKTTCKANVNRDVTKQVGEFLAESGWKMAEEWECRGQMYAYSLIPYSGVIPCS